MMRAGHPVTEAPMRERPAAEVRAAIAAYWLREDDAPLTLGEVELRPHQRDAVGRLRTLLEEVGGALLADGVGIGKTYVALALAREARRPLIVAPAALRGMWEAAMRRTGVCAGWISHESLSRCDIRVDAGAPTDGVTPPAQMPHDLVIVDEAHHARNPRTRRYAALAARTRGARVLLLSATPIHNDRRDLVVLLALFLGARAVAWDDGRLARCIVRREQDVLFDDGVAPPGSIRLPRVAPACLQTLPH
jgi:hypothetical protein